MGKMKAAAFAVAALLLATLCACAGQGSESSASHAGAGPVSSGASSNIVGDMEWLANADIEAGQSGASIAIDWHYLRDASGDAHEDPTPTSTFTGTFDGGMLDAVGSGRVTIAAFWEKDGRQYAAGSFMWPSGETATIALVRP